MSFQNKTIYPTLKTLHTTWDSIVQMDTGVEKFLAVKELIAATSLCVFDDSYSNTLPERPAYLKTDENQYWNFYQKITEYGEKLQRDIPLEDILSSKKFAAVLGVRDGGSGIVQMRLRRYFSDAAKQVNSASGPTPPSPTQQPKP